MVKISIQCFLINCLIIACTIPTWSSEVIFTDSLAKCGQNLDFAKFNQRISEQAMHHIIYGEFTKEPVPILVLINKIIVKIKIEAPVLKSGLHSFQGVKAFIARRKQNGELIQLFYLSNESVGTTLIPKNRPTNGYVDSSNETNQIIIDDKNRSAKVINSLDALPRGQINTVTIASFNQEHFVNFPVNLIAYHHLRRAQIDADHNELLYDIDGTHKYLFPEAFLEADIRQAIALVLADPTSITREGQRLGRVLNYKIGQHHYKINLSVLINTRGEVLTAFPNSNMDDRQFLNAIKIPVTNATEFSDTMNRLIIFSTKHKHLIPNLILKADARELYQFSGELALETLLGLSRKELLNFGVARPLIKIFFDWQKEALASRGELNLEQLANLLRNAKVLKKHFAKVHAKGTLKDLVLAFQSQIVQHDANPKLITR